MKEMKCKSIIRRLEGYGIELLTPEALIEAKNISECIVSIKRANDKISKDIILKHLLKKLNESTPKKDRPNDLRWFTKIQRGEEDKRYSMFKCSCCDEMFKGITTDIKYGNYSCPQCGANETLDINPIEVLKDFKPFPFDNRFFIDKKGTIMSTIGKFKELKPETKKGYKVFRCRGEHSNKRYGVHQLVLEAWGFPKPQPDFVVRHLNDIRDDNRLENLQWGLQKRNMADKKVNQKRLEEAIRDSYQKGIDVETISTLTSYTTETIKCILNP